MMKRFTTLGVWLLCLGLIVGLAAPLLAQSIISGDITGTVTDTSGALVVNATVALTSQSMGAVQSTTTGDSGTFRFSLLRPGNYKLTVTATGFGTVSQTVTAVVGQVVTAPVQLRVKAAAEVVEVIGTAPLLQTENANLSTSFERSQVELLPNPGQDLTSYAFNAPGAFLSTGAGYGNFNVFGLPAASNHFTLNGADVMDPYNNLNNSGASNNLLGANEVQELAVVTNGYTAQYGRLAGANVNFTTRGGTNSFHGNLRWDWTGRYTNSNEWFNKNAGNPTPFMNSNQWAGSFGGPIKKNKLFFFYDNEGLRYVLPGAAAPIYVPTAAFQTNVLAAVPANEVAFYKHIFDLFNGAPGASGATPEPVGGTVKGGCGDYTGNGFGGAAGAPCSASFHSLANSLNTERLMSVRVDWAASQNDAVAFRYWQDRGVQATGTDPIDPLFSANSVQPQDTGNLNWNHIFNSRVVNQFIASGSYYSAIFGPPNLPGALALFPTTFRWLGSGGLMGYANPAAGGGVLGGTDYNYPQGRNVAQYQFVDDLSWSKGNHALKFGMDFRRNNISSFRAGVLTSGRLTFRSMTDFVNGVLGGTDTFEQRFANAGSHVPISVYSLGLYAQDEWRVSPKLKLTLGLRADHNSDESCVSSCLSRLISNFTNVPHDASVPYNQVIAAGQPKIFPSIERIAWAPRIGVAWNPTEKTVIRGGIGIFADQFPGFLADRFITNAPNVTSFTVTSTTGAPVTPGVAGSVYAIASASNTALLNAFASGGNLASIQAILPTFSPPNFSSTINHITNPKYTEWNLEVERELDKNTALSLNYVGNHGSHLFLVNQNMNGWCKTLCPFDGLPTAAPAPAFSVVNELTNDGVSNYNGLVVGVNRKFSKGFTGAFHYTWSHSLDNISNGGLEAYSFNTSGESILTQINPFNSHFPNYGNSDYDFRHAITANYLWELPFKSTGLMDKLIGGWVVSGTLYWRTGQPYSVIDSSIPAALGNMSGDVILANYDGTPLPSCTGPGFDLSFNCLPAGFTSPTNGFGNVARNSFHGPHYFDTDLSIIKNFKITERGLVFSMGANAFNILNHPNFANPDNNLQSGTFGTPQTTVVQSSSPFGNFQGGVFGRVLQLEMKIKF